MEKNSSQEAISEDSTSEGTVAGSPRTQYPSIRDHFKSATVGGLIGFVGSLPTMAITLGSALALRNTNGGLPLSIMIGVACLTAIATAASNVKVPSTTTSTVSSLAGAVVGAVSWPAMIFMAAYGLGTVFNGDQEAGNDKKVENIPQISTPRQINGNTQAYSKWALYVPQ